MTAAAKKLNVKLDNRSMSHTTQIFTPEWMVKYLVENTLGKLWMLNNPNSSLVLHMEYYIYNENELDEFEIINSVEDITFIDPCCGSGNMLLYAIDLLCLMYLEEDICAEDVYQKIAYNNIFGLDVDERIARIARFALKLRTRVTVDFNIKALSTANFGALTRTDEKYSIVVTNPPYSGSKNFNKELRDFSKVNYPNTKSDLYSMFTQRCIEMTKDGGLCGLMTPQTWMFISSHEYLRTKIINSHAIIESLVQCNYSAFEDASVAIALFTLSKTKNLSREGFYVRLSEIKGAENQKTYTLEAIKENNKQFKSLSALKLHLYNPVDSLFIRKIVMVEEQEDDALDFSEILDGLGDYYMFCQIISFEFVDY